LEIFNTENEKLTIRWPSFHLIVLVMDI